jgi:hypothetical protein
MREDIQNRLNLLASVLNNFFSVWDVKKYIAGFILFMSIGCASYIHLNTPPLPFDDAFITFRYVDNYLNGKGLVYNQDQRVFGSTTPLYTLLLLTVQSITGSRDIPELAVRFNLIPFLCCGIVAYMLILHYTCSYMLAAIGSAALLLDPTLLAISMGGMETFVFVSLVLYALLLMSKNPRPIYLGIIIGFAILARLEGVLLIPIACLIYLRFPKKILFVAGAVVSTIMPWIIFATVYYNNPIPVSVIAKLKRVYPIPIGYSINQIMKFLEDWLFVNHFAFLTQIRSAIVIDLILCTSLACFISRTFRQRRAWLPAAFLCGMLICYFIGNPLIFEWYLPPLFICMFITIVTGLPAIGYLAHQWLFNKRPQIAQLVLFAIFFFTLVCSGIMTLERYRVTGAGRQAAHKLVTEDSMRLRIIAYRHAAEILNQFNSKASVASPEIGALGYYFKGRILDPCGLVSPEIHKFLPVPDNQRISPNNGAMSNEMVKFWQPDYIVSMPTFISKSLLASQWFFEHYSLVHTVQQPPQSYFTKGVLIFKKK